MANYHNFYQGADYGLEAKYDSDFLGMQYKTPVANISMAVDPRTANQIQAVTNQLNTGTKAIEVQMTMPNVAEAIPNQHLDELNRLKKLIGAEFTVHGPLVEPTGVTKQGWDESQRKQAERQMWVGLERAKRLDPEGNVVVTFHSSNGLPEPETITIDEQTGQPIKTGIWVVDERTGQFSAISPKANALTGEPADPLKELAKTNSDAWSQQLSRAAYAAQNGYESIQNALLKVKDEEGGIPNKFKELGTANIYKMMKTPDGQKYFDENATPIEKETLNRLYNRFNYGEIYIKEAYTDLQNLFNQAYSTIERTGGNKEDKEKLDTFKDEIKNKLDYIKDPEKISDFADEIRKGINVLNTIKTPQIVHSLKDFAIREASETFSNLAIKAYEKFKDKSPIISIENPPAGSGLSRAEELKELIEETQKKFTKKAREEFGMSESEAKEHAKKLIGATWDVGHINMLRKYGYGEKELVEQTKTIAPFVKHVHLSDNFGMEHTELPMGMGNVPTKRHMEILDEYNEKLKKVIETGDWYQHFKTPPFLETLSAFGSPIYPMQMGPTWSQTSGRTSVGYFGGYGMNPDIHHSIYGAGFTTLPVELGGQIAGRSRLSGAAIE